MMTMLKARTECAWAQVMPGYFWCKGEKQVDVPVDELLFQTSGTRLPDQANRALGQPSQYRIGERFDMGIEMPLNAVAPESAAVQRR